MSKPVQGMGLNIEKIKDTLYHKINVEHLITQFALILYFGQEYIGALLIKKILHVTRLHAQIVCQQITSLQKSNC